MQQTARACRTWLALLLLLPVEVSGLLSGPCLSTQFRLPFPLVLPLQASDIEKSQLADQCATLSEKVTALESELKVRAARGGRAAGWLGG